VGRPLKVRPGPDALDTVVGVVDTYSRICIDGTIYADALDASSFGKARTTSWGPVICRCGALE